MTWKAVVVALLATTAFVASGNDPAAALFTVSAVGPARATSEVVPQVSAPVAVAAGRDVTVTWSTATLSSGTPVTGYVVRRYDPADVPQAVLSACAAVTTASCVEHEVPAGTWTYTVQPVMGSWTGPESAKSAAIAVSAAAFTVTSAMPITTLPSVVTGTISGFGVGATVTYRLDGASGTVLAGSPTTVTGPSMAVSVTLPAGTSDAPHSIFVVDSLGAVASATVDIVMPPVVQSVQMRDNDANGKVDEVLATFSETLAPYSAGTSPWTLTNVPSGGSLSSVTVSGSTATLAITEGPGAATTAVGAFTVALAPSATGIRDVDNHPASFAARAPTDAAAPVPVALTLLDSNGNGKVDRMTAVFSETLQTYSAGTVPWTLADVPSSGTLSSVALSSATLTLTISEGAGAADTSVGSMTVAMASNAGGARDTAGNRAAFAARAPLDGARPVALSIADTNGSVNGQAQPGDTISITFSEPLAPASVPTSTTLTLSDPVGNGNDTLTMAGVSDGARPTGGGSYVTNNGGVASFASSPVALSNADTTVTVTIGATCAGTGCGSLGTQATNGTYSFIAATTLSDTAGNAPVTTNRTASLRLF